MSPDAFDAPPGAGLCAALAAVDPAATPDELLPALLSAHARQAAYEQAQVWRVMNEISRRVPVPTPSTKWRKGTADDAAAEEVRAELRLTRRAARLEVGRAVDVCAVPRVLAALSTGQIDRARAIVLAEACADLTETQVPTLLDKILDDAGRYTCTRLAEEVRRIAIALDPQWAERRYREAVRRRRLIGYLNSDGTAVVTASGLEADEAAAACARVDAVALAAKRSGVAARLDVLRVEVFLRLLDGRFHGLSQEQIIAELRAHFAVADGAVADGAVAAAEPAEAASADPGVRAPGTGIDVRVALATLLGHNDEPGEIPGWGVILASVARGVVARQRSAEWRYAAHDDDGNYVRSGLLRARPLTNGRSVVPAGSDGLVEILVPERMLADADLAARHPAWAKVLAEMTRVEAPSAQDPAARFAGARTRRRNQLRLQRCVFPGCRRPAADCQQDHRRDHAAGGPTVDENLDPLCASDHDNKTHGGWRLTRTGRHTFLWTSALGRKHRVTVDPIARPLPDPIPSDATDDAATLEVDDGRPAAFAATDSRGHPLSDAVPPDEPTTRSGPDPPAPF